MQIERRTKRDGGVANCRRMASVNFDPVFQVIGYRRDEYLRVFSRDLLVIIVSAVLDYVVYYLLNGIFCRHVLAFFDEVLCSLLRWSVPTPRVGAITV